MSENLPPKENLADEFHNLGQSLVDLLHAAWENPERKRVQQEIESNLNEVGDVLKREAESFSESATAQRLKSDMEGLGERIRSSDTQERVRNEVLGIIQSANSELQKVINKWQPEETAGESAAESPEEEKE